MNPNLEQLQTYPFEKLIALKSGVTPPSDRVHIALSIGEPKHEPPQFVIDEIKKNLDKLANYAATKGLPEFRESIAQWATNRFKLIAQSLDKEKNVLPVNGTREALFSFVQAVVDASKESASVLMPNPFYQVYEGAAFLGGAQPEFINGLPENNFLGAFEQVSEESWKRCQLLIICSPGNPSGAVLSIKKLQELIQLADKYDFVIASDECYSELYFDESNAPAGLLQACAEMGRHGYERCVVFHSLSKRSNLPGLRSGFVAGDASILKKYLAYRTYHGCAIPLHNQFASIAAWQDEEHVKENRRLYVQKFEAVLNILGDCLNVQKPDAGFYLWPETPIPDTDFARQLFQQENVTVLPGSFLARETRDGNPGKNRVRMALVAPLDECIEAATRIKRFVENLQT